MKKIPYSSRVHCHLQRSFINITYPEPSQHPKLQHPHLMSEETLDR
jgi:hypothetical protein